MTLRDVGWVWEGQGIYPGVPPSIFGVGEGCEYFGLSRAVYMFHPNTALAMRKLAHLDEVVCDISKWKWRWSEEGGVALWVDGSAEAVTREAETVNRLACEFPHVTGAFHDDMLGLVRREGITPEQYADVYAALKRDRPDLKLWAVVYTHELEAEEWAGFEPYIDVVNLWVWGAEKLPHLEEYLTRCRECFPRKPLNMGCYLRDYPASAPVPMDLLKLQWEIMLRHLQAGTLDGFSILATVLIDGHQEQAEWVRQFIEANA
ncbi:MAG: hypothetical protein ACUVX8_12525 [Candidatus Zipacnadales bacterium]